MTPSEYDFVKNAKDFLSRYRMEDPEANALFNEARDIIRDYDILHQFEKREDAAGFSPEVQKLVDRMYGGRK